MTRTSLALSIDVARTLFDTTVTQAQINANTFPSNQEDSTDLLESMIEDAEDEFHNATNDKMKLGTVGVPGTRETYEQATYEFSGHKSYKRNFTGVFSDYERDQKRIQLAKNRLLPFDSAEGDQLYVYRGIDADPAWEDITDEQGDLWGILNHREGVLAFDPEYYYEAILGDWSGIGAMGASQLDQVRFAISYRYGSLGGSRNQTAEATTSGSIPSSGTATVGITDATGVPSTSEVIVKIDREYLSVEFDPSVPELQILERGVRGTTEASHSSGALVEYTPPAVRKAVSARAAEQLLLSGRYQDWLPDTEDDLDKSDMLSEFQAIWETTVGALSG